MDVVPPRLWSLPALIWSGWVSLQQLSMAVSGLVFLSTASEMLCSRCLGVSYTGFLLCASLTQVLVSVCSRLLPNLEDFRGSFLSPQFIRLQGYGVLFLTVLQIPGAGSWVSTCPLASAWVE